MLKTIPLPLKAMQYTIIVLSDIKGFFWASEAEKKTNLKNCATFILKNC